LSVLLGQTRADLEETCRQLGKSPSHAKTIFRGLYKKIDPASLPVSVANYLAPNLPLTLPVADQELISGYDQSVKFRLRLDDGALIEAVLMPEKARITACVSSQVGCAQACSFCHTGRMGLKRNLTAAEIVGQIMFLNQWIDVHPEWLQQTRLPADQRVANIVFMGMGEPLDNLDGLIPAIKILTDPYGLALGMKHISVSTAGHLDGIRALLSAVPNARLALSLHVAEPGKRAKVMPIERRFPIRDVLAFLNEHYAYDTLIQYTLIPGVNDRKEDADKLIQLLKEAFAAGASQSEALRGGASNAVRCKVNLIPFNEVGPSRFRSPTAEQLGQFRDWLHQSGIRVLVRYSKGQDIAAACGQLVI
jgi:23S rRNA (adenine2503-C2)-methyltransferase